MASEKLYENTLTGLYDFNHKIRYLSNDLRLHALMKRPENTRITFFMNFVRNEVHLYNTSTRTHLLVLQDDHRELV